MVSKYQRVYSVKDGQDISYCAKCGNKNKVINSRTYREGLRRRRYCEKCGIYSATIEIDVEEYHDIVNRLNNAPTQMYEVIKKVWEEYDNDKSNR